MQVAIQQLQKLVMSGEDEVARMERPRRGGLNSAGDTLPSAQSVSAHKPHVHSLKNSDPGST